MNQDRHNPDGRPDPDALTGPLRDAVDHVRRQPVPHESMDNSLDRARQMRNEGKPPRRDWRLPLLSLASMAAVLALTIWLAQHDFRPTGDDVAVATDPDPKLILPEPGLPPGETSTPADVPSGDIQGKSSQKDIKRDNSAGGLHASSQTPNQGSFRAEAEAARQGEGGSGRPDARSSTLQQSDRFREDSTSDRGGQSEGKEASAEGKGASAPGLPTGAAPGFMPATSPRGPAPGFGRGSSAPGGGGRAPGAGPLPSPNPTKGVEERQLKELERKAEQPSNKLLIQDEAVKASVEGLEKGEKKLSDATPGRLSGIVPKSESKALSKELSQTTPTDAVKTDRMSGKGEKAQENNKGATRARMVDSEKREKAKAGEHAEPAPTAEDALDKRGAKPDKKEAAKKKEEARPQAWKRNGRPSFARVYVGDGNALELVSLNVTTTVEGPRARTLVDHVFRNPHGRQLEGTFEYPLPTGASPSYFAMFLGQTREAVPPRFAQRGATGPLPPDALARLAPTELVKHINTADWGRLQEARVVNKQKALETYEEVVRGQIDPALMEYAGGNTFRGRVFPIAPNGYNRVLIAYEEPLGSAGEQLRYRFPLPDCPLTELNFTLNASAADVKEGTFEPKDARTDESAGYRSYSRTWKGEGPGGDAAFTFTPPNPHLQAISARQGESGPLYVYARVRPELKVEKAASFAKHAVFVLDTSLSEHPDRFDLNMRLMRSILEADAEIQHFNVLTFNVGTAWVEPKGWLENTPAGREKVFARLDGLLLEGATDFGAALESLANVDALPKDTSLSVFVLSDGAITWGDTDAQALVGRYEARCPHPTRFHCYRTGLGAENLELYSALTRRGGGIFNCLGKDQLGAVALAHRSQCLTVQNVRFVGGPAVTDQMIAGRQGAVYPGGDLVVVGRVAAPGRTQLVVEGTFNGQKFAGEYPVEVKPFGELAPRGWGEIAVASLLALNDPQLEPLATAYSQEFGIGSQVASFLVLENDNDYKRFNLEQERGKTLQGDLGQYLHEAWKGLGTTRSARENYVRFLETLDPRVSPLKSNEAAPLKALLAVLRDKDFDMPEASMGGALVLRKDVPAPYLASREADPRSAAPYLTEARRRASQGDAPGAARVLSSVIEQHPTRDDALRLVGYRLLDLQQPAHAARLFAKVQRQRPFEPHSYRDLARSLESCGLYGLAAVQYEAVLAGTWHNRFRDSLKLVAREEYASMMREALRKKSVAGDLANHFGNRLEGMSTNIAPGDLRVTISWNTDATDVDLWVIEPDGTKCFYQNTKTPSGGELSQDQTQGYGPERYRIATAKKGGYKVMVHYYRANPNLIAGETHVNVNITRFAGTPQEVVERRTVILKNQGEAVEVARVDH